MRKLRSLLLLYCLTICFAASAKLYTVVQDAKVRKGSGNKFDAIGTLKKGEDVVIIEYDGEWGKIDFRGRDGYIQLRHLKESVDDTPVEEVKKPVYDDVDPYANFTLLNLMELLVGIGVIAAIRKGIDIIRKRRQQANVLTELPKPKPSYWFMCTHCLQKIRVSQTPSPSYCLKAPDHHWINLGESGNTNYQCRHCKVMVTTAKVPADKECPVGGKHDWTDLGELGTKHYYCKGCGTTVMTTKEPSPENCPHGDMHTWALL